MECRILAIVNFGGGIGRSVSASSLSSQLVLNVLQKAEKLCLGVLGESGVLRCLLYFVIGGSFWMGNKMESSWAVGEGCVGTPSVPV